MKSFVPDGDGQVRLSDVEEVSPAAAEAIDAIRQRRLRGNAVLTLN
jgi:hypothetical protein